MTPVTPNYRVALLNDGYTLHKMLPNKVDLLVSLVMMEKVLDTTYEMIGQIKEIKEVIEFLWSILSNLTCIAQAKGWCFYIIL